MVFGPATCGFRAMSSLWSVIFEFSDAQFSGAFVPCQACVLALLSQLSLKTGVKTFSIFFKRLLLGIFCLSARNIRYQKKDLVVLWKYLKSTNKKPKVITAPSFPSSQSHESYTCPGGSVKCLHSSCEKNPNTASVWGTYHLEHWILILKQVVFLRCPYYQILILNDFKVQGMEWKTNCKNAIELLAVWYFSNCLYRQRFEKFLLILPCITAKIKIKCFKSHFLIVRAYKSEVILLNFPILQLLHNSVLQKSFNNVYRLSEWFQSIAYSESQ